MSKKARQRISYVLEHPNSSPGGHRLGVNGLAIDQTNSILYSGGRDGVLCAWDLNRDLVAPTAHHSAVIDETISANTSKRATTFRAQTQAHTHWVNDITLAEKHTAVVSASSDLTVKLWRPLAGTSADPVTIGQHADYVKCVATPTVDTNWVASGGLDRKINFWDLAGGGKTLEIDARGEEVAEKGSIYAMGVTHNVVANGGPESTVRLWDPKSGKRITKFVGHTDMIRSILISENGDLIMSASSDQTVKVWSVAAGRCMHTLTMHDSSVWALFSDDPSLNTFYSADRSGLVVKTDVRGTNGEFDNGLSLAVAQENDGVTRVVAWGDSIWTSTSRASINRWKNVDSSDHTQLPEAFRAHRASLATIRSRDGSLSSTVVPAGPESPYKPRHKRNISEKSILRISNTAPLPFTLGSGNVDENAISPGSQIPEPAFNMVDLPEPIQHEPEETIAGQFGLVKHRLLNDRRRVLTLDTAGEVLLWDLIQCRPIKEFGKHHLEAIVPEVNTKEAVAPWCSIDTSSGNLSVVLEPYNCFDAEMYADELGPLENTEFREDQRINLGKWVLRYLFAKLIDEEIRRDEAFRHKLNGEAIKKTAGGRMLPPLAISIPAPAGWQLSEPPSSATPKATGMHYPPMTPGMAIGLATPGSPMAPYLEGGFMTPLSPLEKRTSQVSRPSQEREDYFADAIGTPGMDQSNRLAQTPATEVPPTPAPEQPAKTPGAETNGKEKEKDAKDKEKDGGKTPSTPFGGMKKFRMGGFSMKLGRSVSTPQAEKPAALDEKAEESESSGSQHEKEFDDNLGGVIQKIRAEYEKSLADNPDQIIETKITPSLANDTPVLKLPPGTKVIIQEETSGGSADVYRGTVGSVGTDADDIEQKAPKWLGECLLQNVLPVKDAVKVSFVLFPYKGKLPEMPVAGDGNNRLNANRMLRVKKILGYVAERIDPEWKEEVTKAEEEGREVRADLMRPEEHLELWCNEKMLPLKMTLATLRTHVWRGGNDIVLYYRSNGKKEIPWPEKEEGEEGKEEGQTGKKSEEVVQSPGA
ncbi:hypothetical protein QBC40DRAFT_272380 [Triangularia verruculosa]|uniref:Uncharacterized protein n=1 Tax=Triangularia verruculosa TaxID=2587418 RepID=A0AAN7AZK6_9PEZI|nr:hypothetical protein QBC40DRAFT_272380 [Triangularia verruculosa]